MAEIEKVLKSELKREELSVIIFRQSCVLAAKKEIKALPLLTRIRAKNAASA
jgi:TPP-dependent indolepyruvate ferredoxin oxidoreductase alpha subunit